MVTRYRRSAVVGVSQRLTTYTNGISIKLHSSFILEGGQVELYHYETGVRVGLSHAERGDPTIKF